MILLSRLIWNIDISGNSYYTDEMILSFLNDNQIEITMASRDVDCDNIVSMLRAQFEYITWVSAHIDGCKLVIAIKENDQIDIADILNAVDIAVSNTQASGMDIIAQESGTITSMITRTGTPLVHVGDEVAAGDILVSGSLEVYDDSQVIIGYHYVEADADIYIETEYTYLETIEIAYQKKVYTEERMEKEYVRIGGYILEAYKATALDETYEVTRSEVSVLSNQQNIWYLSIGTIIYQGYQWEEAFYTENETQTILTSYFQLYCDELMQKGVEILENSVNIYIDDKNATAKGTLQVVVENDKTAATEIRELPESVAEEGITE